MSNKLFVSTPMLAPLDELMPYLQQIWDTGVMTHNGPLLQKFEKDLANKLNTINAVVVNNGTLAIHLAIRALNLTGEIITTPFTFIATSSSIIWENCKPVFVDIDPNTFNINPELIENKITEKTCAILGVHVFGVPCDIDAIDKIAKKYNLKVIYDAAHAIGSTFRGESVMNFGDIATTSLHATKVLNSCEGGVCFTKDQELYQRLKQLRFFGYDESKDCVDVGTNAKMTEVHAAIGLANLKYLDQTLQDRKSKYQTYKDSLSSCNKLSFQKITNDCNCSYFPVVFETEEMLLKILSKLEENNIFPRRYFYPTLDSYKKVFKDFTESLEISHSISNRVLCLPLHFNMSVEDIYKVSNLIKKNV